MNGKICGFSRSSFSQEGAWRKTADVALPLWQLSACFQRAKTLRWARGREGCSDSPLPTLWTPPTPQCNNCDRRQRRKQGGVVGAAASKTRVPPKARSGCWVPQPVAKGCTPLTILKQKSKHKKASAAPVGAIALTLFSLLHLKPFSRCATAPPRGSKRARKLCGLAATLPVVPKASSQRELSKPIGFD